VTDSDGRPERIATIVPKSRRRSVVAAYVRAGYALTAESSAGDGFVRIAFEKVESDDEREA
jgi:hypothetical protein